MWSCPTADALWCEIVVGPAARDAIGTDPQHEQLSGAIIARPMKRLVRKNLVDVYAKDSKF